MLRVACSVSIDPNYISKKFVQVSPQTNFKYLFLLSLTTFVSTTLPKSHSLRHPRVNALLLGVLGSGLHPDDHGYLITTKISLFHHTKQLLLQQHYQKIISWDSPWSGPRPWSLRQLDFAQMVMDNLHPYFWNQWTKSFHLIP